MAIVWCRETSRWEMGSHRGVWVWVGEFYTFCQHPSDLHEAFAGAQGVAWRPSFVALNSVHHLEVVMH